MTEKSVLVTKLVFFTGPLVLLPATTQRKVTSSTNFIGLQERNIRFIRLSRNNERPPTSIAGAQLIFHHNRGSYALS